MTSREALEIFGKIPHQNAGSPVCNYDLEKAQEAYKLLIILVERDTPKKPKESIHYEDVKHNCSVCNSILTIPYLKEVNFCPKCGQRIDWSNE